MVEKYRKITFKILMFIPLLSSVFFLDTWILPQKKTNDFIVSYSLRKISHKGKYSSSSSESMRCYKFYTEKENEFSTEVFIAENEVTIGTSYIFKIVTSVKSQTKDYTKKIVSGLNGLNLWLTIGLLISTICSLLFLQFDKKLSENGFYNILLLNSFIAFILLYFMSFQN
jgi:hypothetical protein